MPARSPSRPARALLCLVVAPGLTVLLTVLLAACGSGLNGTPVTPSPGTSGPAAAPTSPGSTGTGSPVPGTPAPGTPASGATSPPGHGPLRHAADARGGRHRPAGNRGADPR